MTHPNDRDTFDNSFELFEHNVDSEKWRQNAFDTSFESDPFEFSAVGSARQPAAFHDSPSQLFTEDPFSVKEASPFRKQGAVVPPTVRIAILEQVSAMYDDVSAEGSVSVEGSVFIQLPDRRIPPFCLIFRDLLDQVDRLEEKTAVCHNITDKISRQKLHRSDTVLRVTLPSPTDQMESEVSVLNYVCAPNLRPVPLLVKSRVRHSREFTRVGFKIRANPSNEHSLSRIMIILAVPPNMDGQSVRMSMQGGVWDEMKRTIAWSVPRLDPGKALEIQAQFLSVDGAAPVNDRTPTFPVLVRCDSPRLISSVEVLSDYVDSLSAPVRTRLSTSSRVLHRKV